jgi:glycosyltransferase involved in cell wall biosynthesis
MPKVIHLIPYAGIGGVEVAAASMSTSSHEQIDFEVRSIYPSLEEKGQRALTYNPLYLFRAARRIAEESPDVLILSLWRSCIVGAMVRRLNPGIRLVLLIHNSRDAHPADRWFTRLAARYSEEIWADSAASLAARLSDISSRKVRVLSFLVDRLEPARAADAAPVFAFWGRLSPQKNVARALKIFSDLRSRFPEARFLIIGPDGGELEKLMEQADSLGLEDAVEFVGALPRQEIFSRVRAASFYLGTSLYEGMALSVVEAMQLGLVPVVTPVGEIANYCRHGVNALLMEQDSDTVDQVVGLLGNAREYQDMRENAISTWSGTPLYRDSVLSAVSSLLDLTGQPGVAE